MSFNTANLLDFKWYAPRALKISTKIDGVRPFNLRKVQRKFIQHLKDDFPNGIIRSISLKPRQAGWSTLVAGINSHRMFNWFDEKGILLADKAGRTDEVFSIYYNFKEQLFKHTPELHPIKHKDDVDNDREIHFGARRSGVKAETAQDPNAGRSGTRKWAHLTEYAFYPYAEDVDEGVQNSIPLARETRIFKESTAFGMQGTGESFYNQWEAAIRGDSIYKPFFVAWYEIDDYAVDPGDKFKITKEEVEILKQCPDITEANLAWRRLKISEYTASKEGIFTPSERFKQDFPSYPEEAFLNTGRPVFDQNKLKAQIHALTVRPAQRDNVRLTKPFMLIHANNLIIYKVPRKGERYTIGADVAEGVASGDMSTAYVRSEKGEQMASFTGHIDPDHFGRLLVELGTVYNKALIVPELNNMGSTTVTTIRELQYFPVYHRMVFDEEIKKEIPKIGWRTTVKTKQMMLSRLIAGFRDGEEGIKDVELLREMKSLARESSGSVELTGKDRTVAACLAVIGTDQLYDPVKIFKPEEGPERLHFERKDISRSHALREQK